LPEAALEEAKPRRPARRRPVAGNGGTSRLRGRRFPPGLSLSTRPTAAGGDLKSHAAGAPPATAVAHLGDEALLFLFPSHFSATSTRAGTPDGGSEQRRIWVTVSLPPKGTFTFSHGGGTVPSPLPWSFFSDALEKVRIEIERDGAALRRRTLPEVR
jgi:hypothetical protein